MTFFIKDVERGQRFNQYVRQAITVLRQLGISEAWSSVVADVLKPDDPEYRRQVRRALTTSAPTSDTIFCIGYGFGKAGVPWSSGLFALAKCNAMPELYGVLDLASKNPYNRAAVHGFIVADGLRKLEAYAQPSSLSFLEDDELELWKKWSRNKSPSSYGPLGEAHRLLRDPNVDSEFRDRMVRKMIDLAAEVLEAMPAQVQDLAGAITSVAPPQKLKRK